MSETKPALEELRALLPAYEPSEKPIEDSTHLGIGCKKLESFPGSVFHLTRLLIVSLYSNQLTTLPREISRLTSLQELGIYDNHISEIPHSISALTALTELNVQKNRLTHIPSEIAHLVNLKALHFSYNRLTELPIGLSQLVGLTYLDINKNPLSRLPHYVSCLSSLLELNMQNICLTEIPPGFSRLTELKSLNMRDNPLEWLPPSFTAMKNLKIFIMHNYSGHMNVKRAPRGITSLPCWNNTDSWNGMRVSDALRKLLLYDPEDDIAEMHWRPDEHHIGIQYLNFAGKNLTTLPFGLSFLTDLQELHIYDNPIEEIPTWMTQLTSLNKLWIENPNAWFPHCTIKRAPKGIDKMPFWREAWNSKMIYFDVTGDNAGICMNSREMEAPIGRSLKSSPYRVVLSTDFERRENAIGKGGFGLVFKVLIGTGNFAVKVISNASIYEAFDGCNPEKEGYMMLPLQHPNILSLYDFGYRDRDLLFIMEFADGGDLCSHIARNGPLGNQSSISFGFDIIKGLCYLHTRSPPIQHRDLKTENILLAKGVAKLTDFGLSKSGSVVDSASGFKGSKKWSPPEAFEIGKSMGLPSDVYSYGVVLWSMLSGRYPYEGMSDREVGHEVMGRRFLPLPATCPPQLIKVIHDCWEYDFEKRITSEQVHFTLSEIAGTPIVPFAAPITKPISSMDTFELAVHLEEMRVLPSFVCAIQDNHVTGEDFIALNEEDLHSVPFKLNKLQTRVIMSIINEARSIHQTFT